jgi:hypothetical protein
MTDLSNGLAYETRRNPVLIIPIAFMSVLVLVSALIGLGDIALWIFGGDIALLGLSIALEPRVRTLTSKRGKKVGILAQESPMNWLLGSIRFFFLSLAASVAYAIMSAETLASVGGFDPTLFFFGSVLFLGSGVLYIGRTIEWIFYPKSSTNIRLGRVMNYIAKWGLGVVSFLLLLMFQLVVSFLTLGLLRIILIQHAALPPFQIAFLGTCLVSYIGFFRVSIDAILHPRESVTRSQTIFFIIFFSPWLYVIASSVLLRIGAM